METNLYDQPA
jgi:hypothetical protein